MRAWVVDGVGAPVDVIRSVDVERPEPGPGMVRIRVAAAAIGLPDVLMCAGTYPLTPEGVFTPGQEVVGEVTEIGQGVDAALLGTRQMGVTAFYIGSGGLAEETIAAASTIYPAPDELDDLNAAGFHIAFHTGWIALRDRADLQVGETLVVLGAAGGSGSAAVLLGKAIGARVIAVAGGTEKVNFCRDLGADVVIDHREVDVKVAIVEHTDGRGADVVFDPVGGSAGETAARAMASEGRFLLVGFAEGRWPTLDAARMVHGNYSALGVYAGAYDRGHVLSMYDEVGRLSASGQLPPLPTEVVRFDGVGVAMERLADRLVVGKLVVDMSLG
jgi:NADPH2:quinone reductase